MLLAIAVAMPALWLGGVKPWIVPCFLLVVFGLLLRRCLRSDTPLRVPAFWWLGLAAAGLTFVQFIPLPPALVELLAPRLIETVAQLTAGTELGPWRRISVHPGQTGLEAARLLALTGLFVAAAQLSWRLVASYVAATGTVVALIGLSQKLAGAEAIYGVYTPRQELFGLGQALGSPLLTSFVNPNHQSALLLVGLFAAVASAMDLAERARETRGRRNSERLADRAYLAWGAVAIQATALVLSMSRSALIALGLGVSFALAIAMRQPKGSERELAHGRRRRIGLISVLVIMLGLAATQGAWDQLATLSDPGSFHDKVRVAREGLALIGLSPILGIGRGAFVDLFPLVDSDPGPILFTHLESTLVAMLVEWGPVPGGALILGAAWWWLRSFRASSSAPRRIAMVALASVAVQSGADFSLDYLGVAAPTVALAGALSSSRVGKSWACRRVLIAAALGLALSELVAIVSIPASWSPRQARDRALLAGEGSAREALRDTPLDPFVHMVLAREHADAGDWQASLQRARVAAHLRPSSLDAHLLAAVAAARLGLGLESMEHVRSALEALREPVAPELVEWLIAQTPDPASLAEVAPRDPEAWLALTRALVEPAPAHARELAQARARTHPDDPEPLEIQISLALARQNPGLALHHARMLVALRPDEARSHRLRATARFAHREPDGTPDLEQVRAAIDELERARQNRRIDDRGVIDELLVMGLLRLGDPASLDRADELMRSLLARRAKPQERRRRRNLARRLEAARAN